jgi:large-conductance mechanosensitive channel
VVEAVSQGGADPLALLLVFVGTFVVFWIIAFFVFLVLQYMRHRRYVKMCKKYGIPYFPFRWIYLF